jgi:hypothetical protein
LHGLASAARWNAQSEDSYFKELLGGVEDVLCPTSHCAEDALGDPKRIEPGFENIHLLRRVFGEPGTFYARYDRESDTLTEVSPNSLGL